MQTHEMSICRICSYCNKLGAIHETSLKGLPKYPTIAFQRIMYMGKIVSEPFLIKPLRGWLIFHSQYVAKLPLIYFLSFHALIRNLSFKQDGGQGITHYSLQAFVVIHIFWIEDAFKHCLQVIWFTQLETCHSLQVHRGKTYTSGYCKMCIIMHHISKLIFFIPTGLSQKVSIM